MPSLRRLKRAGCHVRQPTARPAHQRVSPPLRSRTHAAAARWAGRRVRQSHPRAPGCRSACSAPRCLRHLQRRPQPAPPVRPCVQQAGGVLPGRCSGWPAWAAEQHAPRPPCAQQQQVGAPMEGRVTRRRPWANGVGGCGWVAAAAKLRIGQSAATHGQYNVPPHSDDVPAPAPEPHTRGGVHPGCKGNRTALHPRSTKQKDPNPVPNTRTLDFPKTPIRPHAGRALLWTASPCRLADRICSLITVAPACRRPGSCPPPSSPS